MSNKDIQNQTRGALWIGATVIATVVLIFFSYSFFDQATTFDSSASKGQGETQIRTSMICWMLTIVPVLTGLTITLCWIKNWYHIGRGERPTTWWI